MRPVSLLCALLALAPAGARAENWVHIRDNGRGYAMCLDKDNIKVWPDGLTHYAMKMCNDTMPQYFAIDCTQSFKVQFVVRIYDIGSTERYREMSVDNINADVAQDALIVCNK
ncbi:MAG TPA: hypothetical protein VGB91_06170 [Rhizomicrobium sp.]